MGFSFRDCKIRDQVLLLTLPVFFILLTAVGLLLFSYWQVNRASLAVRTSDLAARRSSLLLTDLSEMAAGVQGYAMTLQPSFLDDYKSASASAHRNLAALGESASSVPSGTARVAEIRKSLENWQDHWAERVVSKVQAGRTSFAAPEILAGRHQLEAIQNVLAQFRRSSQQDATEQRTRRHRLVHQILVAGIVLGAVFVLMLLILVSVVSRWIARPVHQMIAASDRVREGDFEPELPTGSRNEFGALSHSFLHMVEALRQDREELAAIKRFSEAVTACTSENEVYDQILHALRDRFRPDQVIIFKFRPEEDFLEVVASLSPLPSAVQEWPVIEGRHSCKAVRMGRPFRVNDVCVEPLCPGKFVLPSKGSYYCGPLIAGGIIIGAVRLEGEVGFWTPERESLLESYLGTSASVLSNLQLLQTMREQANIDPLTGLYNRRFCKDYARKLMAMARRKNTPLGFIMLDLDHFKNINDIYGHEVGDRILKQFSKTVTQSMRETNLTARLGGEEFVILLPDTGASACQVVAERIRKAISHMNMPQIKENPLPQLTVSLGIAIYPEHGGSLEEMLHAADRALYESKRGGRNRTTLFAEQTEPAT